MIRTLFTSVWIIATLKVLAQPVVIGLASPVQLQPKQTTIVKSDYFPFGTPIQKVEWPNGITLLSENATEYTITGKLATPLANIRFHTLSGPVDIPCRNIRKVKAVARIELARPASDVRVKGSFNAWVTDSTLLKPIGPPPTKIWELTPPEANEGFQQYKLVVNGKEENPVNVAVTDNGMGGTNALLQFGEPNAVAPSLSTQTVTKQTIVIQATHTTHYFVYWENTLLQEGRVKGSGSIRFSVPVQARTKERSFIRVFAHNERKTGNDILIPLHQGEVILQPTVLKRSDLHTQIMYFLMVDRFKNGDLSNDPKPLDSVLPKAQYMGGDLTGISQKIQEGFFKELGVNTLWLSPISQNPSGAWGFWNKSVTTKFSAYHGYWPTSYSKVDERFGTNRLFTDLLTTAHNRNMNVVLDFVAHHVHTDHPLYQKHPDWVTPLTLPDGSRNTERWDEHRLTTWFDTFLPTLDLQRKEVREVVADSVLFWVRNFELDGFRHDASKHVPEEFWRLLTQQIKREKGLDSNNAFYQIGETYGSPELISSYVNSGQMDAQFDFNTYDAAVGAFAGDGQPEQLWKNLQRTLEESFDYYGWHHLMGNISGNQDRPRFASLADGSVRGSEDTKLAGWTRTIQNNGEKGYLRMAQLMALNMTLPGVPVIYYGDEFAMPGGNDPDNRRMMQFDSYTSSQKQLIKQVKMLTSIRASSMPLLYGEYKQLPVTAGFFAYERNYFGQKVMVVFSKQKGTVLLPVHSSEKWTPLMGHTYTTNTDTIRMQLNADDVEIFILH